MPQFIEISPIEFEKSPFKLIGQDWMLITAEKEGKINTMTASWGGFGVMWNKNVAYIAIRPQRYTKEFIDNSNEFSLTFLNKNYKSVLSYLGSTSGRDENKIENSKLTIAHNDDIPYFEEAEIVIFCNNLYAQEFRPDCFINQELNILMYPDADHHTFYIAEINKILLNKAMFL